MLYNYSSTHWTTLYTTSRNISALPFTLRYRWNAFLVQGKYYLVLVTANGYFIVRCVIGLLGLELAKLLKAQVQFSDFNTNIRNTVKIEYNITDPDDSQWSLSLHYRMTGTSVASWTNTTKLVSTKPFGVLYWKTQMQGFVVLQLILSVDGLGLVKKGVD